MNALKIVKIVVQVITLGASVATAIVADKQQSAKIAEEVAKQLANKQ